ncbi:MAG TPA: iron-containing redox enzyme family protein [Solirubrobacteraceae bacterium]|nr:iron-containing redox enzyme family protein [Solirubrobacteraceae bacterium]
MDVLARLDAARAATDVLQHPFYRRWSAGELSREELALYAGQYRHAVVALAEASDAAAAAAGEPHAAGLARHAEEEHGHVALWDAFAAACGTAAPAAPLAGTADCARAWRGGGDLLERLAVLYAIEASQPAISETKLEGLRAHYTEISEGPATEYFELHAVRDVEHAGAAAELISELMPSGEAGAEQADRMVAAAQAALRGNWSLLDSVQAA